MNINIDQGLPNGDLNKLDDGKYLYKLGSDKFDIDKFNRDFDQYKIQRKDEMNKKIKQKLNELNTVKISIPAYDLSIGQIAINIKDSLFGILDDLINYNFSWDILLKRNRLFYLGITLIVISLINYLYFFFQDTNSM